MKFTDGETLDVKFNTGKYLVPATIKVRGKRLELKHRYNKALLAETRAMEGAKWHGYDDPNPRKIWSVANSRRNIFQLEYLMGGNPYEPYDKYLDGDIIKFESNRPLFECQYLMTSHILTINQGMWAAEMGIGKTLSFIEVMEYAYETGFLKSNSEAWYIGPKAGVTAVGREFIKWDSKIRPTMFTYNGLVSETKFSDFSFGVPKVICFDESAKIKNPTSQRSEAALWIAEKIRDTYGKDGYIIEMSGTPAPKDPTDWWHQCEVVCPGYLKEGDKHKFKRRMCLTEQRESINGGMYPHLLTWLDDENKCTICGEFKDHANHLEFSEIWGGDGESHRFEKSINEVAYLYERKKGLVIVLFKKDWLDLPEKQYQEISIKTTVEILNAAKLLRKTVTRAAQLLERLRELSDGFQYKEKEIGRKECPGCKGKKEIMVPLDPSLGGSLEPWTTPSTDVENQNIQYECIDCPQCGGEGNVPRMERFTEEIGSPKDAQFIDDLDEHSDLGRLVVWGGFMGTIDRLVRMAKQQGWAIIRVDGRGIMAELSDGTVVDADIFLDAMDRTHPNFEKYSREFPRVCFIGNPEAGGMAFTLTAAPTELYYSNSFKGDARTQSEDRCHRSGMDPNRNLIIRDYIHLPADLVTLNNVKKKRDLEKMSMGDLQYQLDQAEKEMQEDLIKIPVKDDDIPF